MLIHIIELFAVMLGLLFVILLACIVFNPLWLMNTVARSKRVTCHKDLAYGPHNETTKTKHARHNLDLYVPNIDANSLNKPIVVFVYGGAWDTGHKEDYKFAAMEFSKLGHITMVPNYRLYPDAKFPHFIEDVAQACAALPKHLAKFNLIQESEKAPLDVIFIGHSAGAHTVAMLNTQPNYLLDAHTNLNIKACIGMAGPYDLPLDDPLVVGKFDGVELHEISHEHLDQGHKHNQHDANPINFATPNMAPMLLMHGRADETVGLYHTERFAKQLSKVGVPHKTIIYDKVPHKHMVAGLSVLFHGVNHVFQDIKQYLQQP